MLILFSGPYLHSIDVSQLKQCDAEIAVDKERFGVDCLKSKNLIDYLTINVHYETDISRLKQEAKVSALKRVQEMGALNTAEGSEMLTNADVFVITNATVLSMETRSVQRDLIKGATIVFSGGKIGHVGLDGMVNVPPGATVYNAEGGMSRRSLYYSEY